MNDPVPTAVAGEPRIHPELRRVARFLPRRAISRRTVPMVRFALRGLDRMKRPGVEVCEVGDITVHVHTPPGAQAGRRPAILWIHGGGFVIGTAAQDHAVCQRLAKRLGAVVAAVDYRLAPEHPFPVPLEDCHDALVWLSERADVDPQRIVIAGASAGGGLAAGCALLAKQQGIVTPLLQVLVYPMLDDRTVLRTGIDERNFRLWTNRSNRFGWTAYLGGPPGAADVSPLAAPARETDLAGVCPAWLGVGTQDLFYEEDLAFVAHLREAGVECVLHVADGAFHGFDGVAPRAQVTREFWESAHDAIETALSNSRPE